MSQKFHQRFNIEVSLDEAARRFVNRAHDSIIHQILPALAQYFSYQTKVELVIDIKALIVCHLLLEMTTTYISVRWKPFINGQALKTW